MISPTVGNVAGRSCTEIRNRSSASSQIGGPSNIWGGLGLSTIANVTAAVNTGADVSLVITGQKAVAGDTLTLEGYTVELLP